MKIPGDWKKAAPTFKILKKRNEMVDSRTGREMRKNRSSTVFRNCTAETIASAVFLPLLVGKNLQGFLIRRLCIAA